MQRNPTAKMISQAVETFWEAFPPFWQRVKAQIRDVAMEQFDISVEQFHILRHIRKGQTSVSELAHARNISRPAVSQAVDVLVQKGLVSRTQDEHDRRHVVLALTQSGNTLLDAIFEHNRQWMEQVFSTLSDEDVKNLIKAMAAFQKIQSL